MDVSKLSLVFVSGNQVEAGFEQFYSKIYQHWYSIWSTVFKELHPDRPFFTDQLTRQDEVMGLFYEGTCISVCCHRYIDMSLPGFRKDSYFEAWDDLAIQKLRQYGDQIIIDNQISVAPEFRKVPLDFKIIELMSFLSFRHLSKLPVAAITASARNTRSMDQIFEKFDPECVTRSVLYHGEETSLYALYPPQMTFQNIQPNLKSIGDQILAQSQRSGLIHPIFSQKIRGESHVKQAA